MILANSVKPILIQLTVMFLVLAPSYLLNRKRELDSQGNPILKSWGVGVAGIAAAAFCGWKAVEALYDPVLCKTDDSIAMFIMGSIFLLAGLASLNFKVTLFNDHIEQRYLFFFTKKYPLTNLLPIEELGKDVAKLMFSDGRKLPVIWLFSGRAYFMERLRSHKPDRKLSSFQIEILNWILEKHETVKTIVGDISREIGHAASEAEIFNVLIEFCKSGLAKSYLCEEPSRTYHEVPLSKVQSKDRTWFLATSIGRAEAVRNSELVAFKEA